MMSGDGKLNPLLAHFLKTMGFDPNELKSIAQRVAAEYDEFRNDRGAVHIKLDRIEAMQLTLAARLSGLNDPTHVKPVGALGDDELIAKFASSFQKYM